MAFFGGGQAAALIKIRCPGCGKEQVRGRVSGGSYVCRSCSTSVTAGGPSARASSARAPGGPRRPAKPSHRSVFGYLCTLAGVLLLGASLYFASDPAVKLGRTPRAVVAGVSAVGGGLLSFGAGRRLLAQRDDEQGSGRG